ncbi:hypothetical protein [Streptomyces sp. NBC_01803]|uniref:hypothetical protein n=1 Tax=Streptomyces sp. NBC_01803 TaxID=2975946 RepID=UPI002DDC170F|nr:hypothetical protein [Streptomyces sp. NBC_01803]WSA47324.1 hypothetical protein OIE51_26025 [Streptomyces sp. NBC_01803]
MVNWQSDNESRPSGPGGPLPPQPQPQPPPTLVPSAWPAHLPSAPPPPPPPPSPPGKRGPLVLALGFLAAAIVTLAVVVVAILAGDGDGDGDGNSGGDAGKAGESPAATETTPAPTPGPTPAPTPGTPSPTPTTQAPTPSPPSGYREVTDEEGFTLFVPVDWERSSDGVSVFYTSPDASRTLQIFRLEEEPTPYDSAVIARQNASGADDYELIGFDGRSDDALAPTSLEYTYTDEEEGPRHVLDHRFVADDGVTLYAMVIYGPPGDQAAQREIRDEALGSFCQPAHCVG